MVFQDPMTFLNPLFTIEEQLVDVIIAHEREMAPAFKVKAGSETCGRQGHRALERGENSSAADEDQILSP